MIQTVRKTPMSFWLLALNLLVFGWTLLQPAPFSSETLIGLGANYGWSIGVEGEWWRLVTGMFLHGGITHILLNMVSLYIVGTLAETRLGWRDYLALYMASGIVGAAASAIMHPEGLSVGASGAIFGMFGAVAGYMIAHRHRLGDRFGAVLREFGGVLLLNLVLGFSIPGIDMSAHIGGLAIGFIGGYLARFPHGVMAWSIVTALTAIGYIILVYPSVFATQRAMY